MIVIRRELPRSRVVGHHRLAPLRHIEAARVLLSAASPTGPGFSKDMSLLGRDREMLTDRPDEARQLASHGCDGNCVRLAPTDHAPVFAVQPLLRLLRDAHDFGRAAFASL